MDIVKEQIRVCLANVYDLQKLRISAGNRIVQSFYIQMGIEPGTSPKESADDSKDVAFIKKILKEYDKVSEAVTEGITVKRALKNLLEEKNDPIKILKSETDFWVVDSYHKLIEAENQATKVVEKYVKAHPLWDAFFKDIKGAGPLMAGVCIAYFDPYKARHVSSFWKYAGLDTVQDKDKDGNMLYLSADGKQTLKEVVDVVNDITTTKYVDVETGEEYIGDVVAKKHGRRKGDTEMFEYTNKDGKVEMKRGITYNPVLKTKLMGVLTGCLIKAKDLTYSAIYYDYKARLEAQGGRTPGKRNAMAQRYMIKQFIRNLWVCWRKLEGLEVDLPYEVAKLGNKPHKYNAYQCDNANVTIVD